MSRINKAELVSAVSAAVGLPQTKVIIAARCNPTDSPAIAVLAAGANIEITTGVLSTGAAPTGGGSAGKITVSAAADGFFYLKNSTAATARLVVDFEPTSTW